MGSPGRGETNSEGNSMSSEIVPADPREIFRQEKAKLDNEAGMGGDGSLQAFKESKLAAILTADSFEAINAIGGDSGLTSARTLVGRTFEIRGFDLRESADQFKNSPDKTSVLDKVAYVQAVDVSDGTTFVIDGGGDQFITPLVRMRDLYDFPFVGTLLALTTGSGYEMHYWRFMDPKRKPAKV
jgi:hypothetical protein